MTQTGYPRRFRTSGLSGTAGSIALAFSCLAAAPAALAGDWSMNAKVSEKVDFDDNYGLDPDSEGYVIGSTTTFNGNLIYLTDISRFDLIGDIVARGYAGPGSDTLENRILPRLETKYNRQGKQTTFDAGARYAFQSIPASEQVDIADSTGDIIKHDIAANFSVAYKVNARDTLNFTNSAIRSIFDGEGTDNFSVDSAMSWSRRLTKRTDRKLTVGFKGISLDDDENTNRYTYRTQADFNTTLSNRLSANAGIGVRLTETYLGSSYSKQGIGYLANAGLNYKLKNTSYSLSGNYGLTQGTTGDLQNRATLSLSISHAINERSRAALNITGNISESIDEEDDAETTRSLNISPTYTHDLTRQWQLTTGYVFTLKDSEDGTAISNSVYLQLSKDIAVFP